MVEFIHHEVMRATKAIERVIQYVVLNCDEVFTIDNQFSLFVQYDVVQNWVKIPILISLAKCLKV
jgi:hypothetical protein